MKGDTIAAIATAPGRGGIGIIRVSGILSPDIAWAITGKNLSPRLATLSAFRFEAELLDTGIALYFPAPKSYTGEDVLELHGHGGPAVLQRVLKACVSLGCRLARPGEFTERAYLNGQLDLAQAESVADLIAASSEEAAKSAVRSLTGAFSLRVNALIDGLIQLRMRVEAELDFPEEDVAFLQLETGRQALEQLNAQISALLMGAVQGRLLRDGISVVLLGQPNVGKSSLLNKLACDDVAIVADEAGTTRDTIRELVHLDGVPVHLVDTAGLRETKNAVEIKGIERTRAAIQNADLLLMLVDHQHATSVADQQIMASLPALPKILIHNKIDIEQTLPRLNMVDDVCHIWLSALTGDGVDLLQRCILTLVGHQGGEGVFLARERHVDALRRAQSYLHEIVLEASSPELMAESLRLAQHALGEITGEFTADDLLGVIFSQFCIGK